MSENTTPIKETAPETLADFANEVETTAEPIAPKEQTTYTLTELLQKEEEELPYLFAPTFLKSGIVVLVGGSDTGKSSMLRQMSMCVASGRSFFGWEYKGEHHQAIYISSEDDAVLTAKVVKRYNKTMQLSVGDVTDRLRFVFEMWNEEQGGVAEQVRSMLEQQKADLVVVDAFGDAFNGKNLNDNTEVRKFYAPFKEIAKEYNCLIIFNHHTGKRSMAYAPDKDNSLGSQAIEAAPRMAMELRTDPNDPDIKHLCIVKANYLSSEYKTKSYALRMDENLVFATTGARVEFAALSKNPKVSTEPKRPEATPNEEHRKFIRSVFADGSVNQSRLREEICDEFDVSDKPARKFIRFYVSKHWIAEDGKGSRNSTMYKSLI